MRLGIIDYGVGNLGSIGRAFEELRVDAKMIERPSQLDEVDRIILPGVGNFTECMDRLMTNGWIGPLKSAVIEKTKPLLGICVGMQLLADFGSEGASDSQGTPGLGLVAGRVDHLRAVGCNLRVPHVGWNAITQRGGGTPILDGVRDGTDFYFVHSYAFVPADSATEAAVAHYDVPFAAVVCSGHVWGTQFHPEKSSRAGFALLRNFATLHLC